MCFNLKQKEFHLTSLHQIGHICRKSKVSLKLEQFYEIGFGFFFASTICLLMEKKILEAFLKHERIANLKQRNLFNYFFLFFTMRNFNKRKLFYSFSFFFRLHFIKYIKREPTHAFPKKKERKLLLPLRTFSKTMCFRVCFNR